MKINKISLKIPKISRKQPNGSNAAVPKTVIMGSGKEKVLSVLCYLGILALIPIFWNNKSVQLKSHVSSGVVLLASWVILLFVFQIPLVGIILGILLLLSIVVFSIWGIYDGIKGVEANIPGVEKISVYLN